MITDYATLQTAVIEWANRVGSTEFAAQVPTFIQLAEAEIRTELRRRKVLASVSFNAESYQLPDDCAELMSVRLVTATPYLDTPFVMGTVEALNQAKACVSAAGRPTNGAVIDKTLHMAPVPDKAYAAEIVYIQAVVPLSVASTNDVLTEAPNLYLYGALVQAMPFLERDERAPLWQTQYDAAIAKLNAKREREEFSASLRPARPPKAF